MLKGIARPALLLCASGLGSCAQFPGEAAAVNDQVIIPCVTECNGPGNNPEVANDYMQVGFSNVYAACEAFFVRSLTPLRHCDSGLKCCPERGKLIHACHAADQGRFAEQ